MARPKERRYRQVLALVGLFGLVLTVVALADPELRTVIHSQTLDVVLLASQAVIGLLLAFLLALRYRQTLLFNDLVIAYALALLSVADLLSSAVAEVDSPADTGFVTWAPIVVRLIASVALAGGAFLPAETVTPRSRAPLATLGATTVTVGTVLVGVAVAGDWLPVPDRASSGEELIATLRHPAFVAMQAAVALAQGVAFIGFLRRARHGDRFMEWLATATVLAVFGRVVAVFAPSDVEAFVSMSDLLRFGFYLVLLEGAAVEIGRYWSASAEFAVIDERERLARDFHDGMTQELVFLASFARLLSGRFPDRPEHAQLATAAERALDESRRAIHALTSGGAQPLTADLEQAARDVATRLDITVHHDLADVDEVDPRAREALIRIVREAVSNAGRHGKASNVWMYLRGPAPLTLSIADDGVGFDPDVPQERPVPGFGLTSMRERARRLGGELRVVSTPGEGTRVEVTVPDARPGAGHPVSTPPRPDSGNATTGG